MNALLEGSEGDEVPIGVDQDIEVNAHIFTIPNLRAQPSPMTHIVTVISLYQFCHTCACSRAPPASLNSPRRRFVLFCVVLLGHFVVALGNTDVFKSLQPH